MEAGLGDHAATAVGTLHSEAIFRPGSKSSIKIASSGRNSKSLSILFTGYGLGFRLS